MATPEAKPRIGFIGLGIMGLPMAMNLARAGYQLTVNTRTASRAQPILKVGAMWEGDAASVARASDIVITMLPDSPDVAAVIEGSSGVLADAHEGMTWIDMSTISPVVTRRLADLAHERGVDSLDAPVSGGEKGAVEGTLSIMVGGPLEVFERCLPLLECMGQSIVHIGGTGTGQIAKLCNQMIVGTTIAAVGEALVVGAKAGADPAKIREALLGGFAQSRILDVHGQRMLEGALQPGFRIRLHQKDVGIALDAARSFSAAAPLTALVAQLMNSAIAAGEGDRDHSALIRVYESLADIVIGPRP